MTENDKEIKQEKLCRKRWKISIIVIQQKKD